MTATVPLLDIRGLKTYFRSDHAVVKAVDDVSFHIDPGKTLGLVGESGSGKSVTSLTVMRLLPDVGADIAGGQISFLGKDLVKLPGEEMRHLRGKDVSMIFQEPGTSLNPLYRVGWQVGEAIQLHEKVSKAAARERTIQLFREVGIPEPEQRIDRFPHELSGGQKQRVMIAMALSCNPKLLIADEPTTALDVTIQKQILDLIRKLQAERQMAVLFITHDLGVIAEIAHDVAVMYRGKIVEYGSALDVFRDPKHPYTKGLLACRPRLDTVRRRLPTVADYMESSTDADGRLVIVEKKLSPERLAEIEGRGRGRLLHPESELKAESPASPGGVPKISSPPGEAGLSSAVQHVPQGQAPILRVNDLKVHFPIKKGFFQKVVGQVKAVDGISFNVYRGQTLGLVGESGCGKTTTGRAIMQLLPQGTHFEGRIEFEGVDWIRLFQTKGWKTNPFGRDGALYRTTRDLIYGAPEAESRRRIQIVFQDPYSSLNPRLTIETMLTEAMAVHRLGANHQDRRDRAVKLLEEVGLLPEHLQRYPHEFSGGQRQRLCIARALSVEPEFLICDESVSALDVSVQAQVLNLLKDLQEKHGLTYIFISHDLSVVKFMSDMMAVMHAGKIVEFGPSEAIYAAPREEYTRKLIASIPEVSLASLERRLSAKG